MSGDPTSGELLWQAGASLPMLRARNELNRAIRNFFHQRGVLEVETPILAQGGTTDPNMASFHTEYHHPGGIDSHRFYLQTSPEFFMKRLLANDIGSIFQFARVFRNGEAGRWHNPEFTMLEWYRKGFSYHRLMDEVDIFLQSVVGYQSAQRITYRELFQTYVDLDVVTATSGQYASVLAAADVSVNSSFSAESVTFWQQLVMSHLIEPRLGLKRPIFVYDWPQEQASLAKIRIGPPPVAERFELFIHGVEIANGFQELLDPHEQLSRFEKDNQNRIDQGLDPVVIDKYFIRALESGMPECSGVALGIDRLLMLAMKVDHIDSVMTFSAKRI